MSCVAEAKATAKAHPTMGSKAWLGSHQAMPSKADMMTICDTNNQLRRRPSHRVKKGKGMRSTSGAHTHLKP